MAHMPLPLPPWEALRVYACMSKRSYITRHAAMRVARRQLRRKGAHLRAYRCRYCTGWHLASDHRKRHKAAPKSNQKGN